MKASVFFAAVLGALGMACADDVRVGIIGLDTSHVLSFTQALNATNQASKYAGFRVTAAYPKGSADIVSSTKRVPEYCNKVKAMGVRIVDSIDELLAQTDVILLESNDGRPHLEQALPVFKAGKRMFIDKPVAGSLADVLRIYDAAERYNAPVFSSSSLRYTAKAQAVHHGKHGRVVGADAFSPCALEPTHPDIFWYGVHGVEQLFTLMGTGCVSVVRVSTPGTDVAVGTWRDGRVGVFRGNRECNAGYASNVFLKKGTLRVDDYKGYGQLLDEIVQFFKTGVAPVSPEETLEIFAFMEAADESKRRGGVPVKLEEVLERARAEVAQGTAQ